jgi:hypothetical protein
MPPFQHSNDPDRYTRLATQPDSPWSWAVRNRFTVVAFDGYIQDFGNQITAVSYPDLNDTLASLDRLAIEAVVDNVGAAASPVAFFAQIQHSADNFHWMDKTCFPEVSSTSPLSLTGTTDIDIGYDNGERPTLGFARLLLTLSAAGGPIGAHVKIYVTGVDLRELPIRDEINPGLVVCDTSGLRFHIGPPGDIYLGNPGDIRRGATKGK